MMRAQFTQEQIIGVLKAQEAGAKTVDLARRRGVSETPIYSWKTKYYGLEILEGQAAKAVKTIGYLCRKYRPI